MSNNIFINYNGHSVTVTCLPNDVFYVQLSHVLYKLKRVKPDDNIGEWQEVDSKLVTPLSKTIGTMIQEQLVPKVAAG